MTKINIEIKSLLKDYKIFIIKFQDENEDIYVSKC